MDGQRLKKLRLQGGLSQEELAEATGVNQATVGRWERGKNNPSDATKEKLASLLGCTVAYLMGEEQTQSARLDRGEKIPVAVIPRRTSACAGNGNGIEAAIEESEEFIDVDRSSFPILDDMRRPFAVYVEGDSMEEMNIPDGAIAVINPAEEVHDGECALVCYKGLWSIKGIRWNKDGSVSLLAGKPQYNMTIPREETEDDLWFSILGRVVGVHRWERPKRFF